MKKIILIGLSIIMFFFKSSVLANYEKIFYEFNIESITGEIINFNEYKGKAILTNLSPVLDYKVLKKILPKNITPAYDGLTIKL